MKKTIFGLAVGAGIIYLCKQLYNKGYLAPYENQLQKFTAKSRRNFRNAVATGKNEAEYLKERAEYFKDKGKEKLSNVME